MNVPVNMMPLMDLIVVQHKMRSGESLKRRVTNVVEVVKSEVGVSFSEIYSYDPASDKIFRTDVPSQKEEKLANLAGVKVVELKKERENKKQILNKMLKEGISKFDEVQDLIQQYYIDPGQF